MADAVVRGTRLHYERLGTKGKLRVVFIHGLVMDNLASYYFTFANAVAAFADVLLYDLRGHGTSERPSSGYRIADMVFDLEGLVDEVLGDGPVVLVGNSVGALIAVHFALKFPEKTRALVLIDGHLGDSTFAETMARTLSLRGDEADAAIASTFEHWLGRHSERKRNRLASHARALVEETTLVADLEKTAPLSGDAFATIGAPTLALFGERSDVLGRSLPLVQRLPNHKLNLFADCTHSILWEATADVRRALIDFLRSLPEDAA